MAQIQLVLFPLSLSCSPIFILYSRPIGILLPSLFSLSIHHFPTEHFTLKHTANEEIKGKKEDEMNWFSWLSRTGLEPSLVYDYTLAFEQNELQEEDIAYLDHEFLQSMGISIAKHRLEILKLARKEKNNGSYPVSKLLFAINNTRKSIARYMRVLVGRQEHQNDDQALMVAAAAAPVVKSYSSRWKRAMLNRNRKLAVERRLMQSQEEDSVMMLTDGIGNGGETVDHNSLVVSVLRFHSFSGPLAVDAENMKKLDDYRYDDVYEYDHDDIDAGYWTPAVEEIRWDAMFQDLKPT